GVQQQIRQAIGSASLTKFYRPLEIAARAVLRQVAGWASGPPGGRKIVHVNPPADERDPPKILRSIEISAEVKITIPIPPRDARHRANRVRLGRNARAGQLDYRSADVGIDVCLRVHRKQARADVRRPRQTWTLPANRLRDQACQK